MFANEMPIKHLFGPRSASRMIEGSALVARESVPFSLEELRVLYRVAQTLLRERDYGELLADLLDCTIQALGADRGFILLREDGSFRATVARNFRTHSLSEAEKDVSQSISKATLQEGKAVLVADAQRSDRFGESSIVRRLGLRSVICAPLIASNEAFALIYLENRSMANAFTDSHRHMLEEICSLSAGRLRTAITVEETRQRAREIKELSGSVDGIITASQKVSELLDSLKQVAQTELPVLIQGETGTGKELVARAIYRQSRRNNSAFVVLNCAAIPATLLESELFGYVRGAFTGAVRDHVGLIGSANRGTVFLDEIGEMPFELQARLLRVLQSGELARVGAVRPEIVDVRFLAATNRDLEREVEEARFRNDLYYRLSAVTLKLPPLRERVDDIPLLAEHFLGTYATRYGRSSPRLADECIAALKAYAFPGNVRELESEMARLAAVSSPGSIITTQSLNDRIARRTRAAETPRLEPMSLRAMEKRLVISVLEYTKGNRTRAAEILGLSREGLRIKLQRLDLAA
jgi:transcriptional regulator with GAF, ATPase, and Fis domain